MMTMERRPPLRMKLLILTLLRSTWLLGDPAAGFTLFTDVSAAVPQDGRQTPGEIIIIWAVRQSWVVTQENAADVLKPEEALRIDSLVECMPVQDFQFHQYPAQFQQHFMENRVYSNMSSSVDVLSMRESVCGCAAPLLDQRRSVNSLSGYCGSCSPAQDSGCWLCSDTSLEKESSWYCNQYCTLSCLQQAGCAAAGCHGDLKAHSRFSDAGMEA